MSVICDVSATIYSGKHTRKNSEKKKKGSMCRLLILIPWLEKQLLQQRGIKSPLLCSLLSPPPLEKKHERKETLGTLGTLETLETFIVFTTPVKVLLVCIV